MKGDSGDEAPQVLDSNEGSGPMPPGVYAELKAELIGCGDLLKGEAVLCAGSDEAIGRIEVDVTRSIQMAPGALEDGEFVALDVRNGDEKDATGGEAAGGALQDEPGVAKMLERVPKDNDVEGICHAIHDGQRVGGLDRVDADGCVQEVDAGLVDLYGRDVKAGVFGIAGEYADPWTDLEELAGGFLAEDWIEPVFFFGGYLTQLREIAWDGLVATAIEGGEIFWNGVHENQTAAAALEVIEA